jgi:hypothetical protein
VAGEKSMNELLNRKIEDNPDDVVKEELENGTFTGHPNKLVCYIDLLGISDYYKELNEMRIDEVKREVDRKFLQGLFTVISFLKKSKEDIYSFHIMGDSIIIVPKSKPYNNKSNPTIGDFFREIIFYCFETLLEHNNPSRVLITRGQYFSLRTADHDLNIMLGGEVFLKCNLADKNVLKGRGAGIFSDINEFTGKSDSKWHLIDIDIFKDCIAGRDRIVVGLEETRHRFKSMQENKIDNIYDDLRSWVTGVKQ